MPCLCSKKIDELSQVTAKVAMNTNFKCGLSMDMPQLKLLLGMALDLGLHLKIAPVLNLKLPSLALGAGAAATLQSSGSALMNIKAAFGINLLDLKAKAQLALLDKTVKKNAPLLAMMPPPGLNIQAVMDLMADLALVLNAKLLWKLDLLAANASLELAKKVQLAKEIAANLNASIGDSAVPQIKSAIGLALQIKAATLAFGLKLGDPKGPNQLSASMSALAGLSLPSLQIGLPRLNLVLALAKVKLMAKEALGIDMADPGAAKKLALALGPLASLTLPKLDFALPKVSLSGLKLLLGLDLQKMLKLDLSGLSTSLGAMPDFSGLSMTAALALAIKMAFNIDLIAKVGCGSTCPLGGAGA